MKAPILAIAATFVAAGPFSDRAHAADDHAAHALHTTGEETHAPPAGRLWPTDEALRTAMTRIREAVEAATPAYERKALTAVEANALAASVEEGVAYMVANCRLPPEPDAALHVLIGRMLSAASILKNDAASGSGLPQLAAVLREYPAFFDHPDWSAHTH